VAAPAARAQEEREERELRRAEMEAAKASNLVEHEAEIYARPARTWFQTPRQKAALSEAARAAGEGARAAPAPGGGGSAADVRRRDKEARRQEAKRKRGAEAAAADKRRKGNRLMEVRRPVVAAAVGAWRGGGRAALLLLAAGRREAGPLHHPVGVTWPSCRQSGVRSDARIPLRDRHCLLSLLARPGSGTRGLPLAAVLLPACARPQPHAPVAALGTDQPASRPCRAVLLTSEQL
jgi:hypothetical protein